MTTAEQETWTGITIDGATTRDRDDGFDLEALGNGQLRVRVFVADVAGAVPRGCELDVGTESYRGAWDRLESRYFPGGVKPMLPRHLSEELCSLDPGPPSKVMAIEIDLDLHHDLEVTRVDVRFGAFRSFGALSYGQVPDILSQRESVHYPRLFNAGVLTEMLLRRRRAAGALALYDLNEGWTTNEEGHVVRLDRDERTRGYIIIQELMILANRELARWCIERDLPVLFRNHRARAAAPDRAELLAQLDDALGQAPEVLDLLRRRTHLVLGRADYGPRLQGHFGLNLPCYLHGTSPIRRYADLVTQRQVRAYVLGEPLPYTLDELEAVAEHINMTLRARRDAVSERHRERDATRMARALDRQGQLRRMTAKEFDRAIKVATQATDGPAGDFDAVYRERLQQGEVGLLGQSFVLLATEGAAWAPLRQVTINRLLGDVPHDALSILAISANVHELGTPRFKDGETEGGFTARATVGHKGEPVHGPRATARTKKGARHLAAVALLGRLAGVLVRLPGPPKVASPAPVKTRAPLPSADCPNSVGALGEWCQASGLPLPVYACELAGGPSHAPVFRCSVAVAGAKAAATAGSKRLARRAAAVEALRRLVMEYDEQLAR